MEWPKSPWREFLPISTSVETFDGISEPYSPFWAGLQLQRMFFIWLKESCKGSQSKKGRGEVISEGRGNDGAVITMVTFISRGCFSSTIHEFIRETNVTMFLPSSTGWPAPYKPSGGPTRHFFSFRKWCHLVLFFRVQTSVNILKLFYIAKTRDRLLNMCT